MSEPIAYLRDAHEGEGEPCYVPAAKGDDGAFPVYALETRAQRKMREALIGTAASLAAAISLLERTPAAKKAAPSDRMFTQMMDDYRAALARARATLSPSPTPEREP